LLEARHKLQPCFKQTVALLVFVVGNTLSNLNVAIPVRARKRHVRRKSTTPLSLQEQDMIAVVSLSTLKDLQGSALIYDSLSSSSFWMVVHFFFSFFFLVNFNMHLACLFYFQLDVRMAVRCNFYF
jgi:hypothetical protein